MFPLNKFLQAGLNNYNKQEYLLHKHIYISIKQ